MIAITRLLVGGAALALLSGAAPAAAQYYPGYGGGQSLWRLCYGYGPNRQIVVNQCTGAVQARLGGYGGYGYGGGRVLGVSQISPRNDGGITVRGVASSGRGYGYGRQAPDLTWRCRTDIRGAILRGDDQPSPAALWLHCPTTAMIILSTATVATRAALASL